MLLSKTPIKPFFLLENPAKFDFINIKLYSRIITNM